MKKKQEKKAQKVDFGSIDLPQLDLTGFNLPKLKKNPAVGVDAEEQTDFIAAYIWEHKIKVSRMLVSTLSLNQKNIEAFARLMDKGYIDRIDMLLSIYFYANEKYQLIPYLRKKLDVNNRFQLAIAGIHTKIVQFETHDGQKIVIHGSANLRSSGNVEQFTIEENPQLYDFYDDCFSKVMERFGTIKKDIRHHELWDVITKQKFND